MLSDSVSGRREAFTGAMLLGNPLSGAPGNPLIRWRFVSYIHKTCFHGMLRLKARLGWVMGEEKETV